VIYISQNRLRESYGGSLMRRKHNDSLNTLYMCKDTWMRAEVVDVALDAPKVKPPRWQSEYSRTGVGEDGAAVTAMQGMLPVLAEEARHVERKNGHPLVRCQGDEGNAAGFGGGQEETHDENTIEHHLVLGSYLWHCQETLSHSGFSVQRALSPTRTQPFRNLHTAARRHLRLVPMDIWCRLREP